MATKLTKPIHRELEIDGDRYIASIVPEDGNTPPSFTLRKLKAKGKRSTPIKDLLNTNTTKQTKPSSNIGEVYFTASDIKSKIAVSEIDYKEKVAVLAAVDDVVSLAEWTADTDDLDSETAEDAKKILASTETKTI